jgi:hypothetical protein
MFLYSRDETWALEGRYGFFNDQIPNLGNVAIGISKHLFIKTELNAKQ